MLKPFQSTFSTPLKTTGGRLLLLFAFTVAVIGLGACGAKPKAEVAHEEEALSRTEFTGRIENFFEYDPLKSGKQSQFLIHLTDLSDGTPVEKAEVTLSIRAKDGGEASQVKARIGKVTGIYVADVNIPNAGDYNIEFHIKNEKLDERLALTDFMVE